ncbi:MAG: ATP-binding protein [Armatimonadota bacterium]|nr:ATP-binding protein [bacterium]
MSLNVDCETRVSLKSSPDYLPRIRKIVACMAEGVGMDQQETDEAKLVLTEACVNAIRHGSPQGACDNVVITFRASKSTIVADVTDCGGQADLPDDAVEEGFGMRLMRKLADKVQFIKHKTGLTVRLTKQAKKANRIISQPTQISRN